MDTHGNILLGDVHASSRWQPRGSCLAGRSLSPSNACRIPSPCSAWPSVAPSRCLALPKRSGMERTGALDDVHTMPTWCAPTARTAAVSPSVCRGRDKPLPPCILTWFPQLPLIHTHTHKHIITHTRTITHTHHHSHTPSLTHIHLSSLAGTMAS